MIYDTPRKPNQPTNKASSEADGSAHLIPGHPSICLQCAPHARTRAGPGKSSTADPGDVDDLRSMVSSPQVDRCNVGAKKGKVGLHLSLERGHLLAGCNSEVLHAHCSPGRTSPLLALGKAADMTGFTGPCVATHVRMASILVALYGTYTTMQDEMNLV